jgi:acyl dehydratase
MTDKTPIHGANGFAALLGMRLGVSAWQLLDHRDVLAFAEATGDRQWIHVDVERCAAASPYGVPVADGYFALSRIAALFFEVVELHGFALTLNYGLNKARFPAPLKVGARYRLVLDLLELSPFNGGVTATMKATVEIEDEPKPCCVAEIVFRLIEND